MDSPHTIACLSALAQETRLAIYRLLVERGPDGLSAGVVAEKLKLPASSLSFHLAHLTRAGLIVQRRLSRQLFYSADFAAMNDLVGFLTENCCGGNAAICAPASSCGPSCTPVKPKSAKTKSAKRKRA